MKPKSKILVGAFLIVSGLLVLPNISAAALAADSLETIVGTVITVATDDEGNATHVAISVVTGVEDPEDEEGDPEEIIEDYFVADNDKGRELLQLTGKEVEATGTIRTDEDGVKTIFVTAYTVLDEPEDQEPRQDPR